MAKSKPASRKKRGPYLAAAFFCETVIEDKKDGVVSAIRIVDTVSIVLPDNPDFPSEEHKLPVQTTGVLQFKTGDWPGEHTLRVVMDSPSGRKNPPFEQTLTFPPEEQGGANITLSNTIRVVKGGVFWFNVYLDGKLFTRMPLKIVIQKIPQATAPGADAHAPS